MWTSASELSTPSYTQCVCALDLLKDNISCFIIYYNILIQFCIFLIVDVMIAVTGITGRLKESQ